jgi:hypothetical protein
VCSAVPFRPGGSGETAETVLADVIVSDGVVQYDPGRRLPEQLVPKDTLLDSLGRPNTAVVLRFVIRHLVTMCSDPYKQTMFISYDRKPPCYSPQELLLRGKTRHGYEISLRPVSIRQRRTSQTWRTLSGIVMVIRYPSPLQSI